MHYTLLFPRNYIAAPDLQGKDHTVVIAAVNREDLRCHGGKTEKKVVVQMQGKEKKWVLNRTNADTIAGLYGTEVNDWIGKAVTLYPTTDRFGPKTVDCIRVRDGVPAPDVIQQQRQEPQPTQEQVLAQEPLNLDMEAVPNA